MGVLFWRDMRDAVFFGGESAKSGAPSEFGRDEAERPDLKQTLGFDGRFFRCCMQISSKHSVQRMPLRLEGGIKSSEYVGSLLGCSVPKYSLARA